MSVHGAFMKVAANTVVTIDYTLRNDRGDTIDSSSGAPMAYLHGHGNIVPGLERALEGLEAGGSVDVKVAPEDGYGVRDEERIMEVPRDQLPPGVDPEPGMALEAEGPDGEPFPLWITEVDDEMVTLDGNHPLAGENLHFQVTVREVRAATADEQHHGHAHGPHGAH
jgi:FKBP-type peptidyl-prolyl cis-trans isomerase SlyD